MYNLNQFVMIKKHLLGGALIVSVLFLFTGCKEIMSHLDNSVDSHLQVADKVTVIGVGKTYQIAKDVDYTTISDAGPTFESLDKTVATVDSKTGLVTALKSGDARIKISLPDNGLYLDASAIIGIKVRVHNTDEFYKNVEALADEDQILFAEDAAVEMAKDVDLSGKKITIQGDKDKPANIANPTKSILIDNDFELVNVVVENNAANFVKIKANASELTKMKYIKFDNVEGKNMQKPLFKSAKDYLIDDFSIVNSKIEMSAAQMVIDFSGGSAAYNVNIENSTFYNTVKNKTTFYKGQSGQKLSELDAKGIQTFNVNNNTFYNWGYNGGSDPTNWWTHRQNSQKWLKYNIKANIFVNCGKSGQAIRGIDGGGNSANPTWNVTGNVMNWGGADTSGSESTDNVPVTGSIAKVVNFKDAANGDFTQSDANAGDPRWYKSN